MIGAVAGCSTDIYEAVVTLSRSIAGCTDLRSLLSGVSESLRRIVRFDHLGLVLHHPAGNTMQGHILNAPGNPVITAIELPVDQDPAGWVWLNQQPLVVSPLQSETRWPEFVRRAEDFGIASLILVPLTAGNHRLGAFGFSSVAPYEPSPEELAFLERVASEFAVAVEAFLARQEAVRERDRLRTLFDITNALVSKLSPDELFSAISDQLSKIICHEHAVLTLCNDQTGSLDVFALHSTDSQLLEAVKGPVNPEGMPAAEVLATGKPVVARDIDIDRYPNPNFRRFVLERSVILTNRSTLHLAMPEFTGKAAPASRLHTQNSNMSQSAEREQIIRALEETNGQVGGPDGAAARLGLKRTTLQSRMRKYTIARQYR
jgi:transcriptional regulator with GAF, ATPase, and Fis domain